MRRLALLFLCFFAATAVAAPLRVSAAASLADVLREIAAAYGQPVLFNLGASSLLARQIEEGAPADVFISADELKMDQLSQRGLIVKSSRVNLLSNTLVIVVPSDSGLTIHSPKDLAGPSIRNIAVAEPQSVPAGIYAKEYLRKLKLWDRITNKLVPTDNVRSTLAAVESGNVEAGIVYKTDALISHGVKIAFEIPREEGPRIVYPAAVLADSTQKAAAQKFLDFLRSETARSIFRRYGFLLP
jgi:molybdate transport system substrate-binding protein